MCVYNGAQFLEEAIRSILEQTFNDFEFIIVNDGSTDGSVEILEKYRKLDTRIKVVRNMNNVGLGVSLQKGIAMARGEFIARMDADDISLPDRIEKQVEYLQENPEIMVIGGDHSTINDLGERIGTFVYPKESNMMRWNMLLGSGLIVSNGAAIIRKKLFSKIGMYGNLRAAQDFELWTRLFDHDPLPITNLDSVIYLYRQHSAATTSSQKNLQEQIAIRVRKEKIEEFLGKQVPEEVILAYRYPTYSYMNIQECVPTWIEIYRKFILKFNVDNKTRREIRKELFNRINKYTYFPPQDKNIEFRVSLWKVLREAPLSLGTQILFSKIGWVLQRL